MGLLGSQLLAFRGIEKGAFSQNSSHSVFFLCFQFLMAAGFHGHQDRDRDVKGQDRVGSKRITMSIGQCSYVFSTVLSTCCTMAARLQI